MLQASPLTGVFGARITDVDLSQYDAELVVEFREQLARHKVLVIENQKHLSPEELLRDERSERLAVARDLRGGDVLGRGQQVDDREQQAARERRELWRAQADTVAPVV